LASRTIEQGQNGGGQLLIRNVGKKHFRMDPGQPLVASVVVKGTRTVVGQLSGGVAGEGYMLDLRPGGSATVGVLFGVTPCFNSATVALPPGRYGVRVVLGDEDRRAPGPRILSPEASIQVTAGS
jgi:hypothetical protein